MTEEKMDRRVRRTRALLQNGLIQLMAQKEIKDISVKELSDLVDINRGTFYLHYNDIYDMLHKLEDEIFVEFNNILDRTMKDVPPKGSPYSSLLEMFLFLEKNYEMARVMVGPHGDLAFVNRLKALVKERLWKVLEYAASPEDFEYYYSFIVAGCVGVIEAWLNHPKPRPPEEMATLCSQLLCNGLI